MKDSLLKKLTEYSKTKLPFHMPGHKRNFGNSLIPYEIDITEIDGFDNLHELNGILKHTADLAKDIYSAKESYPLVNGSTCGVLAGTYSLTRENKKILIARNCHKSVYNAAEILELETYFVMPQMCEGNIWGKVSPRSIEDEIKKHNIGTVVITSPTYDGVVSDISAIYDVCKKYDVRLLVDCAHGAHLFDLHKECDICIMSLHKTLPSLTQTAVLNVFSDYVDIDRLRHGLSIFETSSPSYVLLASVDECLRFVKDNKDKFCEFSKCLSDFYKKAEKLLNLKVMHFDDLGKIIIFASDTNKLKELLSEEKIEIEMLSENYVLLIATVCDTKETLDELFEALSKIDKKMNVARIGKNIDFLIPSAVMKIGDALNSSGEFLDISECEGKIALEYIWAYPPGAPIVVPGEVLSKEVINYLKEKKDLKSTKGKYPKINVLQGE